MGLCKYYILMIIEIISIYVLYTIQGYNFNNPGYSLLMESLILLLFTKISILIVIYYLNIFTRTFNNRYYYILLKIYIILVIYNIIKNLMEVKIW